MGKTRETGFLRNILANDGSALTGYVPNARTLTINGTTQDLSSNRTFNIATSATLGGLTDATISSLVDNQLLKYNAATSKWVNWTPNYLTGITSSQVTTALGYTPVTTARTITINGTAYDLSADRSWTIAGGVTSFNTRTGAITLSSGDVTGALGFTPYNSTNPNGYITGSGNTSGSAGSLNLGGHTISSSSWAGTSGYHGYTYNGGNFRFGFSSTSGVVDVYADGNFYATDSSYPVIHNGNKSSYIDTLYYNGGSTLYTGSDGTRNTGWAYHTNNSTGVHWPNNGWHLYPENANDFYWRSGNSTESTIHFSKAGNAANYIHNSSSNDIGFLSTSRSWILRVTNGGDAYTVSTHYASGYRGSANVGGTGEATWHPAGIYCGSTNWMYGTTYKNGSSTSGQGWLYIDWNYGQSVVGVYSSTRYQGVFAMGDAYKLPADGTSPGNLYGLAWSHPNAGGQAGYLNTHGLLIMENGTCNAAIANAIWARGDVTAYSDARVKDNIRVVENAIEKVKAIRGVTFNRTDMDDTNRRYAGVIAQEVLQVLPEVVSENLSNGHYSVSYGNLAALFIEAIKEQQKEIENLKETINGLTK